MLEFNDYAFGWDMDGNMLYDNTAILLTREKLIFNILHMHLITEQGSYALDRSIGFGLLGRIGDSNTDDNRNALETELNSYIQASPDLSKLGATAEVRATDSITAIEIKFIIPGLSLENDGILLIDITNGRISSGYSFTDEEPAVISNVTTEPGSVTNPFLERLSNASHS